VLKWSRRKRCGAKKKHLRGAEKGEGFYCREWALAGSNRCKWHGGASTGQRTAEGKAKALAARQAGRRAKALALRAEGKRLNGGRHGGRTRADGSEPMNRRDPEYLAARAMKLRLACERKHGLLSPGRVAALIPTLDAAELEKLEALLRAMMRAEGREPELARERAALKQRKKLLAAAVRGAEANIAALGRGRPTSPNVADIAAGKAAIAEYRRLYPVSSDDD
jgi:hypothetical protein